MTGYNLVELTTMDTYHDLEVCIYVVSYLPPHCKKKKKRDTSEDEEENNSKQ